VVVKGAVPLRAGGAINRGTDPLGFWGAITGTPTPISGFCQGHFGSSRSTVGGDFVAGSSIDRAFELRPHGTGFG
jgi:hypothetical protein